MFNILLWATDIPHYELLAYVWWLALIASILGGLNLALKIYERWFD